MASPKSSLTNMSSDEKQYDTVERVEVLGANPKRKGYRPINGAQQSLDRSINLKLDCIVVILLSIDFLLQGIDKTNIGNAATTATFISQTHIEKDDVPSAVSLFSATFITLMPFSTAAGRWIGPKYWIPACMLCWGATTMAMSAIQNRGTLIALRLLLGAFEAGFVPTCYYYITTLYPSHVVGFRLGLFSGCYSVAGAFSGLIAYGALQVQSSRWADWQILFLLEGGLTLGFAVLTCLIIPAKISTAWMLTKAEREHAVYRMDKDTADVDEALGYNNVDHDHRVSLRNVRDALKDYKKLGVIFFNIFALVPVYGLTTFTPLIVQGIGKYTAVQANLMSVPPFVVGAAGLIIILILSDRTHERSLFVVLAMLISIIGYIVLIIPTSGPHLRYGFLCVAMIGAGTPNPIVAAWLSSNTPDKGTRAIVMGLFGWANLAGVVAGQIWLSEYAPTYRVPLMITMILVAIGIVGFLFMRGVYMYANYNRRRVVATWTPEQFEEERRSISRQGHEKRYFVYSY